MENSSNALIIAGSVLIAIIILSIGVVLFSAYTRVGESYEQVQTTEMLTKFNSKFTIFENKTDITAQEIVTLHNFVKEYNAENDPDIIFIPNIDGIEIDFIKQNAPDDETGELTYFKCTEVLMPNGKVTSITFMKNN